MREIGSEFWNVPITQQHNFLFPESTQWFLSGRSALQAIIKELSNCHTVAMPSWCCDSMIKPFVDAGYEILFYPVYFDKGLVQDISYKADVLFLIDYFGYSTLKQDLSFYHGVVIRDITHSVFSKTYTDANYYYGSLRKWCGISSGGYAWTKDGHSLDDEVSVNLKYVALRKKAMHLKKCYIAESIGDNGQNAADKGYLKLFGEAEEILDNVGIVAGDERDVLSARHLDVDFIKKRRRFNAEVLREAFSDFLVFPKMSDLDCPLFVPILVPYGKRDELKRYLISKGIYCPVHWSISNFHKLDDRTRYLYENELSLVCDQRYDAIDMERIVNTIKEFYK